MVANITHAMILAAGLGLRMRPLTLELPKPMLQVGGMPMLDHVLNRLVAAHIKQVVINTHYLPDAIENHVKTRRDISIKISHEEKILDTGGGIKKALPLLGDAPIFVINADLPWQDGKTPALQRLAQHFDPARMDALLLLMPLQKARGFTGAGGDFFMTAESAGFGPIARANTNPPRPYVFISAQIISPHLYKDVPEDVFSTNLIWNRLESAGRLYGLVHDGACYHVGTPPDLAEANRLLSSGEGW